jgi:hypothetical protein
MFTLSDGYVFFTFDDFGRVQDRFWKLIRLTQPSPESPPLTVTRYSKLIIVYRAGLVGYEHYCFSILKNNLKTTIFKRNSSKISSGGRLLGIRAGPQL